MASANFLMATSAPIRFVLALGSLLLFGANLLHAAETIPPKPAGYFNDYAGVVSKEAALRFNEQLAQFERETSNQIIVAVWSKFPSASSLDDFAQRTYQVWQPGQKGKNNGAILFVFVDDHKMRIQTGYGLEGALPDITCDEIIRNEIAPHFKAGDYEKGFAQGIEAIIKAVRGEYKGAGKTLLEKNNKARGGFGLLGFIIFFFILMMALRVARSRGGYRYSSVGGPFFGGWSGGGWSSSSSSGGGFSGFSGGGGSSGGGGASGSW